MKQKLYVILSLMVLMIPSKILAAGTPAGTSITNTATATYNVGAATYTEISDPTETIVAEILEANIVWQHTGTGVTVKPGDTNEPVVFTITNTGNGIDTYDLSANSAIPGDFNPTLVDIYYDTNNNGSYDPTIDTQYIVSNPLELDGNDPANNSMTILVLNTIPSESSPGVPLTDNQEGHSEFTITSQSITGSPSAGDVLSGAGDGGTDAIVGNFLGQFTISSTYVISTVEVVIVKSALVTDQFGGTKPVPGATITYTMVVNVTGSGTAENVTITDNIPANTTYTPESITLNSSALGDSNADGDAGYYTTALPDKITVELGDLAATSPIQTITFDVTID